MNWNCLLVLGCAAGAGLGQELDPLPFPSSFALDRGDVCADVGTRAIAADLNGDGRDDVVLHCEDDVYFAVLMSGDRNGAPSMDWVDSQSLADELESQPGGLLAADLNGDGVDDLVGVSHQWGGFGPGVVLYRSVAGGGHEVIEMPIRSFAGGDGVSLSFGDVTGDGVADVVFACSIFVPMPDGDGPTSVVWLPGTGDGFGDAEFGGFVNADVAAEPVLAWSDVRDVDGDGYADFVSWRGGYSFWVNRGGPDGLGPLERLSEEPTNPFGTRDITWVVADAGPDALPDVVMLVDEFDKSLIHHLEPEGRFIIEHLETDVPFWGRDEPGVVGVIQDATDDGGVGLLLSNGYMLTFGPGGSRRIERVGVSASVFAAASLQGHADGEPVLFTIEEADDNTENYEHSVNIRQLGPGESAQRFGIEPLGLGELRGTAGFSNNGTHVVCADLDHDGVDEVIASYTSSFGTWIGYPATGVTDELRKSPGSMGWWAFPCDVNADGAVDVLWNGPDSEMQLAINDGTGSVQPFRSWRADGVPDFADAGGYHAWLADFDVDGADELVLLSDGSGPGLSVDTYEFDNAAGPDDPPFGRRSRIGLPEVLNAYSTVASTASLDVNGDGHVDLLFRAQMRDGWEGLIAVLGTGNGRFLSNTLRLAEGVFPYWMVVTDLDGDAVLDLILRQERVGDDEPFRDATMVLWGRASGGLEPPQIVSDRFESMFSDEVVAFDVDANGLNDVVVCNGNGVAVHRQLQPRVFHDPGTDPDTDERLLPEMLVSSQAVSGLATGDIDGDGIAELMYTNSDYREDLLEEQVMVYRPRFAETCVADLAGPMGVLNFFDVAEYVSLFAAGDAAADLAEPFGTLNFFDVSAYIAAYNAGCP
ncbi:MAG: FG-GAP-like repeat-containing protein [Phycisphaerales bacterium]